MEHSDQDGASLLDAADLVTPSPIDRVTCHAILQSIPEAVILVGAGLRIVEANASASLLFRRDPGKLRGQHIAELIPDERLCAWLTEPGAPRTRLTEMSCAGVTPESAARTLKIQAVRISLATGSLSGGAATLPAEDLQLLVINDISHRLLLERQLIEAERQAAAAELATDILNGLVETIVVLGATLRFIRTSLDVLDVDDIRVGLDSSLDQLDRVRQMLGGMAGFAGAGFTRKQPAQESRERLKPST